MKIQSQPLSPSKLRANIYKYLDSVAQSGKTLEINRNGVILELSPKKRTQMVNNLKKLKKRKLVRCSDEELLNSNSEKEWNSDPL